MSDKPMPDPHYRAKLDQLMTFWSRVFARQGNLGELELALDRLVVHGNTGDVDVDPQVIRGLASVGFYAVVEHMREVIKTHQDGGGA